MKVEEINDNKTNRYIFEDQTPEYVLKQIKNILDSDSKALLNLYKQASL